MAMRLVRFNVESIKHQPLGYPLGTHQVGRPLPGTEVQPVAPELLHQTPLAEATPYLSYLVVRILRTPCP